MRVELVGQYTWSNRHASEEALLAAALLHPLFRDLILLAHRHGIEALERMLAALRAEGRLSGGAAGEVERMVRNIRRAMENLGDA